MSLKLPSIPPGVRLLTEQESSRLRLTYPASELPAPKDCITCRGTGKFRWWSYAAADYDGTDTSYSIEEFECPCEDQYQLHRYMLHCNIGLSYQRLGWNDVFAAQKAVEVIREWLAKSDAYFQAGVGVILRGNPGTGKTLLVTLALKHLIGLGYDVYFTTFNEMLDMFTATWRDNDEKRWFHRRIKNAGVLGLDDPGKESAERRGSGVPIAALDEVIRHRVAASRVNFVATNDNREKMKFRYGDFIDSLLTERSASITVTGSDFREQARNRLLDEVEQGITRPLVLA